MSIIGKQYIPLDNSYCLNLTNANTYNIGVDYRLAGTWNSMPKVCKIVSEPYDFEVLTGIGKEKDIKTFVNVSYAGDVIRVLFHTKGLTMTMEECKKRIENYGQSVFYH